MSRFDWMKKEDEKVMPKIIDMLSGAVIFASAIAAVPMALCNPDGPAFVAWVLAVMLSGQWMLWRYWADNMKTPRPSSNSGQGQRKFYNIILAENKEKVKE